MSRQWVWIAAVSVIVSLVGCSSTTNEPEDLDAVTVRLEQTGGVAGVGFEVILDGDGTVRGGRCANGCDWQDGDVLGTVPVADVAALLERFEDAGFRELDGRSFGLSCCDFFHFTLILEEDGRETTVQGGEPDLPDRVLELVRAFQALVDRARS